MSQQEIITPEIIDLQPAPVKGTLAKSAWDTLPLANRTSDNLATIRQAVNHSGSEFLNLCHREGLRPDYSVIVVNHTENHYHTTNQGIDAAQIAAMMQQANQPLIEALRAQQTMSAPAQQGGLTAEEVLAIVQAQQANSHPAYYPQPYYELPEINIYNDVRPTVSACSYSSSKSESDSGYGGGWPLWFGVAWLAVMALAIVGSSSSD